MKQWTDQRLFERCEFFMILIEKGAESCTLSNSTIGKEFVYKNIYKRMLNYMEISAQRKFWREQVGQ